MRQVLRATFGDATGDEQRRMMTALLLLLGYGVEAFAVQDDRGGSGSWSLSIEQGVFDKLPALARRNLKLELRLTTEDAAGSIDTY